MIRLDRARAAIPPKYRGADLQKLHEKLLAGWYSSNGKVPFNKNKSFQVWKDAKVALQAEAFDKCAYCESWTSVNSYGDVEHFRPKDVYWWLAFSYDNYTFSCQLCNQKFKGANFPVAGAVLTPPALPAAKPAAAAAFAALASSLSLDPANDTAADLEAYFKKEKAHLPHPYLDEPERLFAWRIDDTNREVTLVPKGKGVAAKRAAAAADKFLGLNREELRRARYATLESVRAFCGVVQANGVPAAVRELAIAQLRRAVAADAQHAGMVRWFLRDLGVQV